MHATGILIPAYKPGESLVTLTESLCGAGFSPVVVVDDGSGEGFSPLFERVQLAGALVLRHAVNMGKGVALRTGINHFLLHAPDCGVITVDADGQHAPGDVLAVADAMDGALVLGVRTVGKDMPLMNRFGNALTCLLFSLITGLGVSDTQTGLRALPASSLAALLALEGDRYEYEMNMLLALRPLGLAVKEVPIATIYEDGNRSSHFRPLRDGIRIYRLLLSPLTGSFFAAAVDFGLFALCALALRLPLVASVAAARVVSTLANHLANTALSFRLRAGKRAAVTWTLYLLLTALMMTASYFAIHLLHQVLGWDIVLSKLVSDAALYTLGFFAQRDVVFAKSRAKRARRVT